MAKINMKHHFYYRHVAMDILVNKLTNAFFIPNLIGLVAPLVDDVMKYNNNNVFSL